ncbi:hypothetical protein SLA2020_313180 [Shorea laevis]
MFRCWKSSSSRKMLPVLGHQPSSETYKRITIRRTRIALVLAGNSWPKVDSRRPEETVALYLRVLDEPHIHSSVNQREDRTTQQAVFIAAREKNGSNIAF